MQIILFGFQFELTTVLHQIGQHYYQVTGSKIMGEILDTEKIIGLIKHTLRWDKGKIDNSKN